MGTYQRMRERNWLGILRGLKSHARLSSRTFDPIAVSEGIPEWLSNSIGPHFYFVALYSASGCVDFLEHRDKINEEM